MDRNDHPRIRDYKKKFLKENPEGRENTNIFRLDAQHRGSVLGYAKDYRSADPQVKGRIFRKFTGSELTKFLENEDYVFGDNKKGNNIKTFMKVASGSDKIHKVLKKALSEFNEFFMNMDLEKILADEVSVNNYLESGLEQKSLDFIEEYEQIRQSWALKAVFPNINNIRTWFIKTGIFKSQKYAEFLNLKTTKQRLNFIDSAVFLIANGIYAAQLGQSTKKTVGVRNPREVYVRSGAAATIGKARRYRNKGNVSQRVINRREKKS